MIRAKVTVSSVRDIEHDGGKYGEALSIHGVHDGTPENNSFARATPVLNMQMQIDNPAAFGKLVPGQNYFLDFSPAN